jgi:Uma2 family endonuclease
MKAVMVEMLPHWLAERKNSEAAKWDEMWDGVLHMPPMPNEMHQDFEDALAAYLRYRWAKPRGAKVFTQIDLTLPDVPDWTRNYRVPDLLLLTPDRYEIRKGTHFSGAPLVVGEVYSPGDETYEKLPFYATLGVPEVWVFDRDTRAPEVHVLTGSVYQLRAADPDGWLRSAASGVEFRQTRAGKVWVRITGDEASAEELPDD